MLPVAVFCPLLPNPRNGLINYASDTTAPFDYQTTAQYQCNLGYGLVSSSSGTSKVCGPTGEWIGIAPVCNSE